VSGLDRLVVNADSGAFTLILFGIVNPRGDPHTFLIFIYLYTDNTVPANF
jgi:ABC-type multidrug transport system permease subunit